ncbi:hypothetical protein BC832DRAFT_620833 [Gaertneriomyces semiglobifer]|nr:hypothetical protein BC832DRAFT_620833 [Gaertneriomyces semiglobifer]
MQVRVDTTGAYATASEDVKTLYETIISVQAPRTVCIAAPSGYEFSEVLSAEAFEAARARVEQNNPSDRGAAGTWFHLAPPGLDRTAYIRSSNWAPPINKLKNPMKVTTTVVQRVTAVVQMFLKERERYREYRRTRKRLMKSRRRRNYSKWRIKRWRRAKRKYKKKQQKQKRKRQRRRKRRNQEPNPYPNLQAFVEERTCWRQNFNAFSQFSNVEKARNLNSMVGWAQMLFDGRASAAELEANLRATSEERLKMCCAAISRQLQIAKAKGLKKTFDNVAANALKYPNNPPPADLLSTLDKVRSFCFPNDGVQGAIGGIVDHYNKETPNLGILSFVSQCAEDNSGVYLATQVLPGIADVKEVDITWYPLVWKRGKVERKDLCDCCDEAYKDRLPVVLQANYDG